MPGLNSRLDEMQAAILRVKLRHLAAENSQRQAIARQYSIMDLLTQDSAVSRRSLPSASHVYHQYVIRTPHRDRLQQWLREQGVGTLIHYLHPVHLHPAYLQRLPTSASLSNTEQLVGEILSLPMFPQLTQGDVSAVIDAIHNFVV